MAEKDGEWKMLSFAPAIKYYEQGRALLKASLKVSPQWQASSKEIAILHVICRLFCLMDQLTI